VLTELLEVEFGCRHDLDKLTRRVDLCILPRLKRPIMARFDLLPQRLRREIFRHLLLSDRVRLPPNELMIEHYDFQVALLRVNSAFQADAAAVFYGENAFVRLHWTMKQGAEPFLNHEVPFFKLKQGAILHHHIADIWIDFDEIRSHLAGGIHTFLMLLEDIPKLARMLRILDFANFMGYKFKFEVLEPPLTHSPPSYAT
jgi:hypothetical protein